MNFIAFLMGGNPGFNYIMTHSQTKTIDQEFIAFCWSYQFLLYVFQT